MGCMEAKPASSKTLYERYANAGLVQPQFNETENNFERELFFAINLLRHQPKNFIPAVQRAYKDCPQLKKSRSMKSIIAALREAETLPLVAFDDLANQAVRENNKAIVAANESKETIAAKQSHGNIEKYQELNSDQAVKAVEASQFNYEGDSGEEMIVLLLAQFYDKKNAVVDPKSKTLSSKEAEAKKKADADGAAGDKETGAADADAKDAEGEKDTAKSKITSADTMDASPLLDPEATLIGISNKGHTMCLNSV